MCSQLGCRSTRPAGALVRARLVLLVRRRVGVGPRLVVPDPGRAAAGAGRRCRRGHLRPGPPSGRGPHRHGPLEGGRPRHPDRLRRRLRRSAHGLSAWAAGRRATATSSSSSTPATTLRAWPICWKDAVGQSRRPDGDCRSSARRSGTPPPATPWAKRSGGPRPSPNVTRPGHKDKLTPSHRRRGAAELGGNHQSPARGLPGMTVVASAGRRSPNWICDTG